MHPNDQSSKGELAAPDLAFLAHGGEMGELMRALDWSHTAVGPVDTWSSTLRNTVRLLLANRFPMLLWWGADYIQFYNDAYRPIPGAKHPPSMGQPARECWSVRNVGASIMIHTMFNAHWEPLILELPPLDISSGDDGIDTSRDAPDDVSEWSLAAPVPGPTCAVQPSSLVILFADVGGDTPVSAAAFPSTGTGAGY